MLLERVDARGAASQGGRVFPGSNAMKLFGRVFLACAVLSAACGANSPTAPGSSRSRVVAVLGDSLAVSPSRDESFPAVLQARIDEAALDWLVVNHSSSGDTTSDGVRRLDEALREGPRVRHGDAADSWVSRIRSPSTGFIRVSRPLWIFRSCRFCCRAWF
jgi:hypothetical protein